VPRVLRASLAAALLSLAVVPLAALSAQADRGVTTDDNSPSAKEYAIPLDEARKDSGAGAESSGSDGTPAPFGQGVATPERSSSSPRGARHSKITNKQSTSTTKRATTTSAEADQTRTVAAAPAGGDSGSSSGQALAGGAALVIVAGGAAGLWARRRRPAGDLG
jgi:hypothetical protein